MNKSHIVLIEDDIMLAELIESFLTQKGFLVTVFNSAETFFQQAQSINKDVVISDINMPEMNGFELCYKLRQFYSGPFIFLTARSEDEDQIKGLSVGADDYIQKPVKPPVLLARIQSILNTKHRLESSFPKTTQTSQRITLPNLIIDKSSRLLEVDGRPIAITSDDLELLWFLIESKDEPVSREDLFSEVVGREYDGQNRVIDGRISRLRKKFNSIKNNPYEIKTIWRLGYVFTKRSID